MKSREPRLTCVIKARMRLDGTWKDVCIRNISSRGMLIQAASELPRGTYVEVYRGRHVIVARVAWSKDHRFGIYTQERLNIDAVLQEPDLSGVNYKEASTTQRSYERRERARPSDADLRWRAERSTFASKALEFACIVMVGASGAAVAFDVVADTLTKPMAAVTTQLSGDVG
jgi:hypothetical protein